MVLEIKSSEQKIRVGLRQTQADPFDFFKDKPEYGLYLKAYSHY